MDDKPDITAYLLARVHELEEEVADLNMRLRYNADKQKNYRRSKRTAARSNGDITEESQSSHVAVTPLPQNGNAALLSPPQTPSLLQVLERSNTYASDLSSYIGQTWPSNKPLREEQERAWRDANPGVDLLAAAKAARAWQLEDLQRRTRPRVYAFLGNWFRTAQQRMPASVLVNGGEAAERAKAAKAASRTIAETRRRIEELDAVKPQPMPESLRSTIAKIGSSP